MRSALSYFYISYLISNAIPVPLIGINLVIIGYELVLGG